MSSKTKKKNTAPKKEVNKYSAKDKKRITVLVSAFIAALLVITWFLLAYGSAVNTVKPLRKGTLLSPSAVGIEDFEYISVTSNMGDRLEGWYLPASGSIDKLSDKVVIISHNYESSRESAENDGMYFYKHLIDNGFDVVAFDYSGSGESTGKYYTFGVQEKDELLAVIDEVHAMNPQADISLCGWAFGAAAAITAGCESEHVSAIIADSSYTDLDQYFDSHLKVWTGLPSFMFDFAVKGMMEGLAGCDFSDSSPISAISETSGKRFFFIHAKDDPVIPTDSAEALCNAATKNNFASLWIIENVPHICGFAEQEDNYVNRVLDFLTKNQD